MSSVSYLETLARKRSEHLNALALVPDADHDKHVRIKGILLGLDEAVAIFKAEMKIDDEETPRGKS